MGGVRPPLPAGAAVRVTPLARVGERSDRRPGRSLGGDERAGVGGSGGGFLSHAGRGADPQRIAPRRLQSGGLSNPDRATLVPVDGAPPLYDPPRRAPRAGIPLAFLDAASGDRRRAATH